MTLVFNDSKVINSRLELNFFQSKDSAESILLCIEDFEGRAAVHLEPEEAEKLANVILAWCNCEVGYKLLATDIFDDNG